MTREEAIKIFNTVLFFGKCDCQKGEIEECFKIAIKALEQEPFINKPCISAGVCEHDKQKALDKIRAEIESLTYYWCEVNPRTVIDEVLDIIDKYKVESEE